MDYRKRFAADIRMRELPSVGPFKILGEPQPGNDDKFSVRLVTVDGELLQIRLFEGAIGRIFLESGDGYCEAYESEEKNLKGQPYINFRRVRVKKE